MNADGATLVALPGDSQHRRIFIDPEISDVEIAGSSNADRTEKKQFDQGSIFIMRKQGLAKREGIRLEMGTRRADRKYDRQLRLSAEPTLSAKPHR